MMTAMIRKILSVSLFWFGLMLSPFVVVAQDADAYDGTGVKPPEALLLQEGKTIGDIRLPKGTGISSKKSVILGSGPNAYGKIHAAVRAESDMVARFFLDNMPGDGWELISEFQSDDITFVFQKSTRVVLILIERGKRSTTVKITLTPRS